MFALVSSFDHIIYFTCVTKIYCLLRAIYSSAFYLTSSKTTTTTTNPFIENSMLNFQQMLSSGSHVDDKTVSTRYHFFSFCFKKNYKLVNFPVTVCCSCVNFIVIILKSEQHTHSLSGQYILIITLCTINI